MSDYDRSKYGVLPKGSPRLIMAEELACLQSDLQAANAAVVALVKAQGSWAETERAMKQNSEAIRKAVEAMK